MMQNVIASAEYNSGDAYNAFDDDWSDGLSEEEEEEIKWMMADGSDQNSYETPINLVNQSRAFAGSGNFRGSKPDAPPKPNFIPYVMNKNSDMVCPPIPSPSIPTISAPTNNQDSVVRQTALKLFGLNLQADTTSLPAQSLGSDSNRARPLKQMTERSKTATLPLQQSSNGSYGAEWNFTPLPPNPPPLTTLPSRSQSNSPNFLHKLGDAVQLGSSLKKINDSFLPIKDGSSDQKPVIKVFPQQSWVQNLASGQDSLDGKTEQNGQKFMSLLDLHEKSLQKYQWYHDYVSREQAERRLSSKNIDGCFLVRKRIAKNSDEKPYALSIFFQWKIYHLQVRVKRNGCFAVGLEEKVDEPEFSSVAELINYYRDHSLSLVSRNGQAVKCTTVLTLYPSIAEFAMPSSRVY